ncbi:glycosyltransferase family 2 protein [Vibrio cholerae]|nr:glycosyltransferase [Vibrio cholerae]EMC3731295.1 glycosyltransferase [Vibrio cholerae]HDG1730343.1 glycosyltransferase [Vibrio cholerae]
MKVSIVLPTYNGERFISESIDSIICQTYENWELIIVNDCSKDNTLRVIEDYLIREPRIRLVNNEINKKLPASLNIGFSHATGDYLTWTSDDNICHKDYLETLVSELSNGYDFVYSDYNVIDEHGKFKRTQIVSEPKRIIEYNVVGASFMYTRFVYEFVGNYDINLFLLEDYDYWLRVVRCMKAKKVPKVLYSYREHSDSLSGKRHDEIQEKLINYFVCNFEYNSLFFTKPQLSDAIASQLARCIKLRNKKLAIRIIKLAVTFGLLSVVKSIFIKVFYKNA